MCFLGNKIISSYHHFNLQEPKHWRSQWNGNRLFWSSSQEFSIGRFDNPGRAQTQICTVLHPCWSFATWHTLMCGWWHLPAGLPRALFSTDSQLRVHCHPKSCKSMANWRLTVREATHVQSPHIKTILYATALLVCLTYIFTEGFGSSYLVLQRL